jgi:hypothetical protein
VLQYLLALVLRGGGEAQWILRHVRSSGLCSAAVLLQRQLDCPVRGAGGHQLPDQRLQLSPGRARVRRTLLRTLPRREQLGGVASRLC